MVQLALAHPKGFGIVLLAIVSIVCITIYAVYKNYCITQNRKLRNDNIRTQGWPPEHLDADGDPVARNWFAENQASEARIARHEAGLPD